MSTGIVNDKGNENQVEWLKNKLLETESKIALATLTKKDSDKAKNDLSEEEQIAYLKTKIATVNYFNEVVKLLSSQGNDCFVVYKDWRNRILPLPIYKFETVSTARIEYLRSVLYSNPTLLEEVFQIFSDKGYVVEHTSEKISISWDVELPPEEAEVPSDDSTSDKDSE